MWMRCYTLEEIGEQVDLTPKAVDLVVKGFCSSVQEYQNTKTAAEHASDYEPALYNVWKQQTRSEGLSRIDKEEKDRRNRRILEMHLRCFTQEEIAKVEGVDHTTVHRVLCKILDPEKCTKPTRALIAQAENVAIGTVNEVRSELASLPNLNKTHLAAAEREAKKEELARLLSVSPETVRKWLARIDKDEKDRRDKRILEMWMQCFTDQEIAEAENLTSQGVGLVLKEMVDLPKLSKTQLAAAEHATEDFDVPLYNLWTQAKKSEGVGHFGNSEVRWVDHLLLAPARAGSQPQASVMAPPAIGSPPATRRPAASTASPAPRSSAGHDAASRPSGGRGSSDSCGTASPILPR
jgi:hypothetical protein